MKPYKLYRNDTGSFEFHSKNQTKYQIIVQKADIYFSEYPEIKDHIFDFSFEPINRTFDEIYEEKPDKRIEVTIIEFIKEFFMNDSYKNCIIYVCYADEKAKQRNRLFNMWFANNKKKQHLALEKLNSQIIDESGIVNYTSIILHTDNPQKEKITTAFKKLTKELSKQ